MPPENTTAAPPDQRRWLILLYLLPLLAAGLWAWWAQKNLTEPALLANGGLVVDAKALDFGTVWEDAAFAWTLPLHNYSGRDIHIERFITSCHCVAIEPPSLHLPAGGEATLRLTLDLRAAQGTADAKAGRAFAIDIAPIIEGVSGTGWKVTGRVRPVLSVTPELVDFGHELIRGQPIPPRTIKVVAYTPLQSLTVTCTATFAEVHTRRLADPKQPNSYAVTITFHKDMPAGQYRAKVQLTATTATGQKAPPVVVPIQGRVVNYVKAVPAKLILGARAVGETVEETVTLQSYTGEVFAVERIDCGSENISIAPIAKSANTYQVKTHITRQGSQTEEVIFAVVLAKMPDKEMERKDLNAYMTILLQNQPFTATGCSSYFLTVPKERFVLPVQIFYQGVGKELGVDNLSW